MQEKIDELYKEYTATRKMINSASGKIKKSIIKRLNNIIDTCNQYIDCIKQDKARKINLSKDETIKHIVWLSKLTSIKTNSQTIIDETCLCELINPDFY